MFRIVDDSECRRYRQDCAKVLTQVRDTLRDEKDIITQFTLVGSGARNMVTRNGDGPFDLDNHLLGVTIKSLTKRDGVCAFLPPHGINLYLTFER